MEMNMNDSVTVDGKRYLQEDYVTVARETIKLQRDALEQMQSAGWRSCIDHIIKPESACPICRIEKLEAALTRCVDEIEENLEFEGRLSSFQEVVRLGREALQSGGSD